MTRSSDKQGLGEVKQILRRLEMVSLGDLQDTPGKSAADPDQVRPGSTMAIAPATPNLPVAVPPRAAASFGSMSILIANVVMMTATCTSLAWYLVYSSVLERQGVDAGQARLSWLSGLRATGAPPPAMAVAPNAAGAPLAPAVGSKPGEYGQIVGPDLRLKGLPNHPISPTAPDQRSVSLTVPATVEARSTQTVRVQIGLDPSGAALTGDVLMIAGLPESVEPNGASAAGAGRWLLPASSMGELELKLSDRAEILGRHAVALELLSRSGVRLAAAKTTLVIAPLAVPDPRPAASGPPIDEDAQRRFLAKGADLYALGHVNSARLIFERAVSAGNAAAAVALGDTYDPRRLMQLGAPLNLGDLAKATYWYERADELGSTEAKARILGLAQR
jgi:hypothetical protein